MTPYTQNFIKVLVLPIINSRNIHRFWEVKFDYVVKHFPEEIRSFITREKWGVGEGTKLARLFLSRTAELLFMLKCRCDLCAVTLEHARFATWIEIFRFLLRLNLVIFFQKFVKYWICSNRFSFFKNFNKKIMH